MADQLNTCVRRAQTPVAHAPRPAKTRSTAYRSRGSCSSYQGDASTVGAPLVRVTEVGSRGGTTAPRELFFGGVEQLVARRAHNPKVAGSSPAPASSLSRFDPSRSTARPHGGASVVGSIPTKRAELKSAAVSNHGTVLVRYSSGGEVMSTTFRGDVGRTLQGASLRAVCVVAISSAAAGGAS